MTAVEDRNFLADRIAENESSILDAWQEALKSRPAAVAVPENELPCVLEYSMLLIKARLEDRGSGQGEDPQQDDSAAVRISRWDEINLLLAGEEAIGENLVETWKEPEKGILLMRIRRELNLVINELIRERTL